MAETDYISLRRLRRYTEKVKELIGQAGSVAIEDKPSLGKLLVTLNPDKPDQAQYLVARDPYTAPATPTFSPASGGSGNGSLVVTISCTSSDVTIKYSTDNGTTWVTGTSVTLQQDTAQESKSYTLKAKAVNNIYGLESEIATATYTVKRKVATPNISPLGDTYNATQTVTLSCATRGATIYYTTDGSTPKPKEAGQEGKATKVYTVAISVTKTGTVIKAVATKAQWVDSNQNSATYVIKVKTPTITLSSGDQYSTSRTVTLACDTNGATIYYTTNGTTPNPNEADQQGKATKTYSSPFTLSDGTFSVWVLATKTDWENSGTAKENNIVVGTKYTHAGLLLTGTASEVNIADLTQEKKAASPNGNYTFTTGASAMYIWFVVPATQTIHDIANGAVPQAFSLLDTRDGYKFYRLDGQMGANQSITLTVS